MGEVEEIRKRAANSWGGSFVSASRDCETLIAALATAEAALNMAESALEVIVDNYGTEFSWHVANGYFQRRAALTENQEGA